MRNEKILSVKICSSKKEEILRSLDKRIKKGIPTVIFTPNTKMLLQANASPAFLKILNSSSLNIPDGSGILIASRMLGGNIKQRITGIDFAASLLALAEKRGYRVFLLGSERGVAKKAKKNLKIYWTPETGQKILKTLAPKFNKKDWGLLKSKYSELA